ncbi:MAG: hypothetical protein HY719_14770 [Planctomycetes bacterium]|nr:hypothetical protein [Planctomycetota bacterium]
MPDGAAGSRGQARLASRRGAGFTVMEILVTIAVLTVGIVGVVSMFPQGLRSVRDSVRDTTAANLVPSVVASIQAALYTPNPAGAPANSYILQMPELSSGAPKTPADIRETWFILNPYPATGLFAQNLVVRYPDGTIMDGTAAIIAGHDGRLTGGNAIATYPFADTDAGTPVRPLGADAPPDTLHWTVPAEFQGNGDESGRYSFDFVCYPSPSNTARIKSTTAGPYVFEVRVWFGFDPNPASGLKFDDPSLNDPSSPNAQIRQFPVRKFVVVLTPGA